MPPPQKVRFRQLRIGDHRAAYALWSRTEGVGLNESDRRPAVAAFLRRNPGLSQVATSGGRVIATLLCGHDGRRGYLHHLAVDKKWRRRGIGSALVAASLERLRGLGIVKCNLFLFTANVSGRAFWLRMGWGVRADLSLVQRATARNPGSSRTGC
jgi:putative acetyltransferase